MTEDALREIFEAHYPLPAGIKWDGDHFEADRAVIGSYTNATAWGLIWRGFKSCAKEFGYVG